MPGTKSLYDLAKARLIGNIHMLDDIGDLPYAFLAPILRSVQNPDQLMELEKNCPQLLGETGELWLRYIKRDIPNWDKKPHQPRDDKNWSKVYRKLKRDAEKEEEEQAEALKQRMQALKKGREGNQTTIVEGYTGRSSVPRKAFGFAGSSSWARSAAPKETGKVAFDKLRRGIFDQKQARPKASQMPAHILAQRKKATVSQAPARMVRMQEAVQQEAPQRMLLSKTASSSVVGRTSAVPAVKAPVITSRTTPRPSQASPERAERARLPAGQQFSAPRPQSQRPSVPGGKRRREEPSILYQPKRPKM
jgi:elongin-A